MVAGTYLLDTSALLAHYFGEPGADEVDRLWREPENKLVISVLSIPEFKTRLALEVRNGKEAMRAFELYINHLTASVPVSRPIAEEAARLREAVSGRLPLVDAVIAATAKRARWILVHRDPHMSLIPERLVAQLRLPDRRPDLSPSSG